MEKIHQKLWEIECKLEELKDAFVESEMKEEEAREYDSKFAELEESFGKIITLIARKKGIRILPPVFFKRNGRFKSE